jgi:predicted transcriptional regulator
MTANLNRLTTIVVSNYVEANALAANDLADLIHKVRAALGGVSSTVEAAPEAAPVRKLTAAQIRKSITPDALISFEDGKSYKTLKRHLTGHGLTPASYREKWGLGQDYPMVAPAYSAARSAMAKSIGLGAKGRGQAPAAPTKAKKAAKKSEAV